MDVPIRGTCTAMCPEDEIKLRESERMLHILEMLPGTEDLIKPKTNKSRIVKMYSRSAAGSNMSLPKNLRTADTLVKTVNYLLHDVISSKLLSWHLVYDFIADRLLAVRQDMVIQRLSESYYIALLQPIIRFYAYSAYKLCEHPIEQFDPALNNMHLQETLKRLLKLYDDCEHSSKYKSNGNANITIRDFTCGYFDQRPFFESLYVIFNLGDISAICRILSLQSKWRTNIVKKSLDISIAVLQGNWYKACLLIKNLPTFLAAIASLHLPCIRRDALRKMTVAYNSKTLTYPVDELQRQLLYSNKADVISDCFHYNLKVENDAIKFIKIGTNFNEKTVKPKHEKFVYEKFLGKNLSDLVLHSNI